MRSRSLAAQAPDFPTVVLRGEATVGFSLASRRGGATARADCVRCGIWVDLEEWRAAASPEDRLGESAGEASTIAVAAFAIKKAAVGAVYR
jgi:hypothetical protein